MSLENPSHSHESPAESRLGITDKQLDAQLEQKLASINTKDDLYGLGHYLLRRAFVPQKSLKEGADKISGKLSFGKNKNFERWTGLAHILPNDFKYVTVTTPSGQKLSGLRSGNGSFHTDEGRYIAIWDGYEFEANKNPPLRIPEKPQETDKPQADMPQENKSALPKIPLRETLFIGDSLTVGAQLTGELGDAQMVAEIGKQTSWMLEEFKSAIDEMKKGLRPRVQRVVIRGGINDIASGISVDKIEKKLEEMYSLARANGMTVVACTHHKWDTKDLSRREKVDELNRWILAQEGRMVDKTVDVYAAVEKAENEGKKMTGRDGLHLTSAAAKKVAQLIKREGGMMS